MTLPNGPQPRTLVDLLEQRAERQPGAPAFTFLGDAADAVRLTNAELERRVRAVAARLQAETAVGDRALLLYPPGLDFIAAFFGCLFAGLVPVPAYPPRRNQKIERLRSILADAGAAVVLTTTPVAAGVRAHLAEAPELDGLPVLSTDEVDDGLAASWRRPALSGSTLAFLQYTSGSTSAPKGVMVSHQNLLHNSEQIRRAFGLTPEDVSVTWLPSFHDMGLIDGLLQPLYSGFPAYLMSPAAFLQQPARWLKAISEHRATHSGGPNFAYELCVKRTSPEQREGLDLTRWRMAYNGAEPIRRSTMEAFAAAFAPHGFRPHFFYPCYGLAEATLLVSGGLVDEPPRFFEADAQRLERHEAATAAPGDRAVALVGCGRTYLDTRVLIVDPETRTRCGPDRVGEIWVSGAGVAEGYWRNARATEETFQARLADTGEGPFLRTGDLGFLREGELFVTGRLKDLLIVRGRNHYPQDIELTARQSHPALRPDAGAAFSVEVGGEERLVVVHEVERVALRGLDVEGVAAAVRREIAEQHELQAHAVVLLKPGQIPKTSSGKIQRGACRARFLAGTLEEVGRSALGPGADAGAEGAGPRWRDELLAMPEEARRARLAGYLRRAIAQALRIDESSVTPERGLLQLGLDSLAATELQHRLEGELGVAVPMALLLQDATAEQLAGQVLALGAAPPPGAPQMRAWPPAAADGHAPSRGQQALWFLHQLAPQSAAYNVSFAARVVSALHAGALEEALRTLARRHSALRTSFDDAAGRPELRVHDAPALDHGRIDATGWTGEELQARLSDWAHRPFDLQVAPLLRTRLFSRGERDHVLLFTAHHLVADLWSLAVLLDELPEAYAAASARRPPALPPPSAQPAHHAAWQAGLLAGPKGQQLWSYWRKQLEGAPAVLDLPADRPRPPVQSFRGAVHASRWDAALADQVRSRAAALGVTPYMLLLAAFQALLHRYSGQEDLVVGSSVSGRTRPELAGTVGYLVNQVVLRARLSGGLRFADFLGQVRRTVVEALSHQDYPLAPLVERLQPGRDPSRSPLFQVMFLLERSHQRPEIASLVAGGEGAPVQLGELSLEPVPLEMRTAQFDLTLKVIDGAGPLTAAWEYSTDLFDEATIRRMDRHLRTLLQAAVERPDLRIGELPLLEPEERRRLLVEWNATAAPYRKDQCAHERFEAQAARTPDATALVSGARRLSYRELDGRANQLARHLSRLGVGREALVGVCLPRSAELVEALLGVLKAGAAYVPLDPSYPPRRLAFMLEDAKVAAVLSLQELLPRLPPTAAHRVRLDADREEIARNERGPLPGRARPGDLAYVIYTSGSTGRPKGVMIEHRALGNYLDWCTAAYEVERGEGAPVATSIGFDATVTSLFPPLLVGKKVVLLPEQGELDGLVEALRARQGFSLVKLTPAHLDLLASAFPALPDGSARAFVVGGEALSRETAASWRARAPGVRIVNEYGPTETVVGCCTHEVAERSFASGTVPIGRPIANTRLYILDAGLQPAPAGVPGELYISGAGLARGYLGRPELTAEKLTPDPFCGEPGARMYRTGDLARYLPDGEIEFLGRADDQVKIRGFRVELGEVEAALRQHPAVREAAAAVRPEPGGSHRLVGYVVWKGPGPGAQAGEVRRFLAESLPHPMVPAAIVPLEALPLTPHGKVDRSALPDPGSARPDIAAAYVAPDREAERVIADAWKAVLRIDRVGADDNFFDLGGHSLLAAQVRHLLQEQLKRDISLLQLFQYPTVRALADHLGQGQQSGPDVQRIQERIQKQRRALDAQRKKREKP